MIRKVGVHPRRKNGCEAEAAVRAQHSLIREVSDLPSTVTPIVEAPDFINRLA
jgi:hypothetical protein